MIVLITEMERMPESCEKCQFRVTDHCKQLRPDKTDRSHNCPLLHLPSPDEARKIIGNWLKEG